MRRKRERGEGDSSATEDPFREEVDGDSGGDADSGRDPSMGEGSHDALVDVGPGEEEGGGEEFTVLERELADLSDRHLRLAAEFENYRKRTREELLSSGARAQASLVGTLLDALDDVHRVSELDQEQTSAAAVLEGVRLVERKLDRALADAGLEWVDPEGEPFDPESMEAMMRVPTQVEEEDDTVDQVFQRGVRFKGLLVRPARVTVRKLGG
jgi:molecular chaperone GrpE